VERRLQASPSFVYQAKLNPQKHRLKQERPSNLQKYRLHCDLYIWRGRAHLITNRL